MISIDCEMTGLDIAECAVVSVGAIDLQHPEKHIYLEMRPFQGAKIDPEALLVNGYTEEALNALPLSQEEGLALLKNFLDEASDRNVVGQNVSTDVYFLNKAFLRAGIECKIPYRVLDLHSMVCAKLILNKEPIPMEERKSSLNLDTLLTLAGIPEEPKPHIALTGALSAAEVYFRLIEGRAVLPEFSQYEFKN
jgi:DNA polymerase III epsilon subunit-like protein